jgi:DNA-binding SARP family transcriptional activator
VPTLRILGGLWLANGATDSAGRASQRRRLALLTLVALSPDRRLTRDKALAILWPEVPTTEARRRLSAAVYDLRQALGEDVIESHGDELWISPRSKLEIDAEGFENAVARADWEAAVAAYSGPLLDGVHIADAPEFEEWVAEHRERLRRRYAAAVEALIADRQSRGDSAGAIAASIRLSEIEPLSARLALVAARSIHAAGDRSTAINLLEQHIATVRDDLRAEADPTVLEFANRLRTASSATVSPSALSRIEPSVDAATSDSSDTTLNDGSAPHVARRSRRFLAGSILALACIALTSTLYARHSAADSPAARANALMSLDHDDVTSPSASADLRTRVSSILGASLLQAAGVDAKDGNSNALITRGTVTVTIQLDGARLKLRSTFRDAATHATVAIADNEGGVDSLTDIAETNARLLIANALGNRQQRIASEAVRTTTLLDVVNAFLVGEEAYRHGHFSEATRSFQAAVARDPQSALAHYRLALSLLWEDKPIEDIGTHDSLAVVFSSRLGADEQTLIAAYADWRKGRARRADSLLAALVDRAPGYAEAWYQLGETRFHYGPGLGRPAGGGFWPFSRVLTIDSLSWGARWHLLLLDAPTTTDAEMRSRVARLLASHPDGSTARGLQLFSADLSSADGRRLADSSDGMVLFDAAWRRAVFRRDFDGADRLLIAMRSPTKTAYERAKASFAEGALRMGQGRLSDAAALLLRGESSARDAEGIVIFVQTALAFDAKQGRASVDSLRADVDAWRQHIEAFDARTPLLDVVHGYLSGLLAARSGDSSALKFASSLERIGETLSFVRDRRELAEVVRAYYEQRRGNCVGALTHLDRAAGSAWFGYAASSPLYTGSLERFLRAQCLHTMGRDREAIAWYQSMEQNTIYDLAYLGPSLGAEASIYRAIGQNDAAGAVETRLGALWRDADHDLKQRFLRAASR